MQIINLCREISVAQKNAVLEYLGSPVRNLKAFYFEITQSRSFEKRIRDKTK